MSIVSSRLERLGLREKVLFAIALVAIAAWLADQMVVRRVVAHFRALDRQIDEKRTRLAYNLGVAGQEDEVRAVFGRYEGALGEARSTAEALDSMKGQIDVLARRAGVTLLSMEQRDIRPSSFLTTYTLDIREFEADMKSLVSFLHALGSVPGLLKVERLTLAPGRSAGGVRGAMRITKVMIPAAAEAGKPAGEAP